MAFFWRMTNARRVEFPFCMNLTEKEERLVIVGYTLAKKSGRYADYWMSHIEEYFFNNANALSLNDLCHLNVWLSDAGYSDICYIPVLTENPSTSQSDRQKFAVRREQWSSHLDRLSEDELYDIGQSLVVSLADEDVSDGAVDDIDGIQNEGMEAYSRCMDQLSRRRTDRERDSKIKASGMPEPVSSENFIIGGEVAFPPDISHDINEVINFLKSLKSVLGNCETVDRHIQTLEHVRDH